MKIDHLTIVVGSFEASDPYYDALLPLVGFTKLRDHVWTDEDGFFFQFIQAKPNTKPYERYGVGLNHLGFSAKSSQQVLDISLAMRNAGFEVPDIQSLSGAEALFMKDSDGLRFEITYYPEGVNVVD